MAVRQLPERRRFTGQNSLDQGGVGFVHQQVPHRKKVAISQVREAAASCEPSFRLLEVMLPSSLAPDNDIPTERGRRNGLVRHPASLFVDRQLVVRFGKHGTIRQLVLSLPTGDAV